MESESINRKILRAALIVGFLTILVKAGSTVKELIVAQSFGRGDALDAFLIAFLLPSFVVNLVMGSLGAALIPTFVETRQNQGNEAAQKLFSSMMLLSLLVLATMAILLGSFAPYYLPYLGSGFSTEKLRLTGELLYTLLPFVLFSGIATCASSVMNAGEKFALPSLTPLMTPLIVILFIELGATNWGAFSLAGGIVAGSFLEAVLLSCALKAQGLQLTLRWNGLDPKLRSVLGQYAPMLAGAFLMGGTSVVDQSMAAMLPKGSVAALGYASKIVTAITSVGGMALSTAVLPYYSRMVARNDWNGFRNTLKRYFVLVFTITIPITLGLMLLAKPLIRLLFQRGAFTSADTQLVSWVQVCYSIQIPFYVGGFLFVRFISSIKRNDVLMYGAGINLILDIVLNLLLMRVWGVAGIALSTSLVYAVSFTFLGAYSIKLLAQRQSSALSAVQEQGVTVLGNPTFGPAPDHD
jgi:putative peptidoglycan lipid II flippase